MIDRTSTRRLPEVLLAGALALLFTAALLLLFSHLQVSAQPDEGPEIQKTVNTTQAEPGDTLTYTVHIVHDGAYATLWMTDTLPPEVQYVDGSLQMSGPGSADHAGGVITWTASSFGYGNWVWITFTVEISPDVTFATVVNTVEVTGTGTLVASDPVSTQVSPGRLEPLKTVFPPSARPGEQLLYAVYITNTGNGTVDSASMTDSLPPEVSWAGSLDASKGNWGVASGVITWTGSLLPSEVVAITFTARITSTLSEETSFANTAEITGAGTLVTASVEATAIVTERIYFPSIFRSYPPIAVLNPIPTPDANGAYLVSWVLDSPYVARYVLQESANPSFSPVTMAFTTTAKSQLVENGSSRGYILYYRVRADDGWGEGPWSNVQSVNLGYYDDFSDSGSGWQDDKGKMYYDDDEFEWKYWRRGYQSGTYRFYIDQGGPFAWFYQPDSLAPYQPPTDKYCVETSIKFEKRAYWANMGLIFGANSSNTELYALCLSYADNQVGWFIVKTTGYIFPKKACFGEKIKGNNQGTSVSGWNRLQVGVDGNRIQVYVGGSKVYEGSMSGLSSMARVGLIGGVYEVTPVDIRADYFKVIPNASCSP